MADTNTFNKNIQAELVSLNQNLTAEISSTLIYDFSPKAKIELVDDNYIITITDKDGTTTATIPLIKVQKNNNKTDIYSGGTIAATVLDGQQGPQGIQGEDGNGISLIRLNDDYTLTFIFTDGTSYTTESIRGMKGEKGDKGDIGQTGPIGPQGNQGIQGEKGQKGDIGDVGNGIASIVLNDDYTLTIKFTDGSLYITPSIRGEQGEQGIQGERGEKGDKGDPGDGAVIDATLSHEGEAADAKAVGDALESKADADQIIEVLNKAVEQTAEDVITTGENADRAVSAANTATIKASEAAISADRAEQAVANAGYMQIDIDTNGHLIYKRTDAVDVDFKFDGDGHLIMEV